jgi:serine/threonine protein kinase
VSRLILGEVLGEGDSAKVVAARYLDEDVAVKIFKDTNATSILEEVGRICCSRHEFIVEFLGVSTDAKACDANGKQIGLALVMKRAKFGSVLDVMRDHKKRKMFSGRQQWLLLLARTAKAILYLHSQSPPIIHRDIKPGNVLVSEQHQPLLADFGLACYASNDSNDFKGTCNYLAPELFEGEPATMQTDVYAFALFMWFVASGAEFKGSESEPFCCTEPWEGDLLTDIMERVVDGIRPAWPHAIEKISSLARFRQVSLLHDCF